MAGKVLVGVLVCGLIVSSYMVIRAAALADIHMEYLKCLAEREALHADEQERGTDETGEVGI